MAGSPGNPVTRVVVVIPAHDEREGIRACVDSVLAAAAEVDVPVTVRVVLDTCTDGTGEHVPDGVETRTVAVRNVGAARAAGVDDADGGADVWLAHTDADTIVGAEWLRRQLAHADAGADAVAGTIHVRDWSHRPDGVRDLHDRAYTHADGHGHVHGANLGVRGSAYAAVGGFRPLPESEDVDLVARLDAAGATVVWAADCPVVTSSRVSRRTGGGFSGHLDSLTPAAEEPFQSKGTA